MLLKNIVAFSLLAFQAGFGLAKPISVEERGVERIAELEPASPGLVRREDQGIKSGTLTGTDEDSIFTFGLATCPGLAASGTAAGPGGVNKVLTHVSCWRPDTTFQRQIDEWVAAVRNSGMRDISIVVDILNPDIAPAPARQAQEDINNAAKNAANTFGVGYAVHYRQSMADPPPEGELRVNRDGSITIGGRRIRQ